MSLAQGRRFSDLKTLIVEKLSPCSDVMQTVTIFLCESWGKLHSILCGLVIHSLEDACKLWVSPSQSWELNSFCATVFFFFSSQMTHPAAFPTRCFLNIISHVACCGCLGIYLEPYSPSSLLPHLSHSLNPSSGFPGCLSQPFTHMLASPPSSSSSSLPQSSESQVFRWDCGECNWKPSCIFLICCSFFLFFSISLAIDT